MGAVLPQASPRVLQQVAHSERSAHRLEQQDEQQPDASPRGRRALAKLVDEQEAAPTGARQQDDPRQVRQVWSREQLRVAVESRQARRAEQSSQAPQASPQAVAEPQRGELVWLSQPTSRPPPQIPDRQAAGNVSAPIPRAPRQSSWSASFFP
jgi:hypothetical protein